VDVAAVQANGEWQVGPRQFLPLGLAALDEHGLFGAKLGFAPPGDIQGGPPHRRDVQLLVDWQEVVEHAHRQPVGDQRSPARLQVLQLWRAAL